MLLNDNHLSLTSVSNTKEICMPLFTQSEINYFHYVRVYLNGESFALTTNGEWYKHVFKQNYHFTPYDLKPGYSLLSLAHSKIAQDARLFFNIDNMFRVMVEQNGYYEIFAFASWKNNNHIVEYYFNNLNRLNGFMQIFKQKAAPLIESFKTEKNKIFLPTFTKNSNIHSFNISRNRYYFLTNDTPNYITGKEFDCLTLLAKGKAIKEIARDLNNSQRTIESHIAHIREKTGYYKKSDLINFFSKNFYV